MYCVTLQQKIFFSLAFHFFFQSYISFFLFIIIVVSVLQDQLYWLVLQITVKSWIHVREFCR